MKKKLVILFIVLTSLMLTACDKNDFLKEESRVVVTPDEEVMDINEYVAEIEDSSIDMTKRDYSVFDAKEAEITKILDDLEAPLDIMIQSTGYGNYEDLNYTFNVPEGIVRLSKEKTVSNNYRFDIIVISEVWFDGDPETKETSKFAVTYPDGGLKIRRDTLVSFDGDHEQYFKMAQTDNGEKHVFDVDNHFICSQYKFVVLDRTNGVIYNSDYSDRVGFGLGYPEKDKVILPNVEVEEYNAEYYLSVSSDFSCPCYYIKLNSNEEFREFVKYTREKSFIRIDVEDIYGEYKQTNMFRLDFYAPGDYIEVVLPADSEKSIRTDYNTHDVNMRLRYEIYDTAPFVEEPIQTTDWTYLNIKTE